MFNSVTATAQAPTAPDAATVLGNVREAGYDWEKIRQGEAAERFVADKRARLCRCTHECNARTMLLFDRANALPVLAAMAGIETGRPS